MEDNSPHFIRGATVTPTSPCVIDTQGHVEGGNHPQALLWCVDLPLPIPRSVMLKIWLAVSRDDKTRQRNVQHMSCIVQRSNGRMLCACLCVFNGQQLCINYSVCVCLMAEDCVYRVCLCAYVCAWLIAVPCVFFECACVTAIQNICLFNSLRLFVCVSVYVCIYLTDTYLGDCVYCTLSVYRILNTVNGHIFCM